MTAFIYDSDYDVSCPLCEYPIWVRLIEVVAHVAVTCPCCRARIWLSDSDGSVQNSGEEMERALDQVLKNFNI
jgi:hypothetical protein